MFDMLEVIFYEQHSMATEVGFLGVSLCAILSPRLILGGRLQQKYSLIDFVFGHFIF